MKIAYIVPGSGDTFYCENCMRDMVLIKALKDHGHDVVIIPMYLPFFLDNPDITDNTPVFFGGLNVYLQQQFKFFRTTPRWLDSILDKPWLLKIIAKQAGSTRADNLGEMTLSMLNGENGNQVKELKRLTAWMKQSEKPDIIHISNALLSGIAAYLKKELDVPIICSLQDEDGWLDAMNPPYDKKCWDAISSRSEFIDAYISVSSYYGKEFVKRTGIPETRMHAVHIGINPDEYSRAPRDPGQPTIGYLARMSPSLGLGTLVDAFIILKKSGSIKGLRLKAAGGAVGDDLPFLSALERKLDEAGVRKDVEFITGFNRDARIGMLESLSVLSVPVQTPSAFGTYILEALASGVPVVQPASGAFPELINATGGGVIYSPNTPEALAQHLEELLLDSDRMAGLAETGRQAIRDKFDVTSMASGIAKVYDSVLE